LDKDFGDSYDFRSPGLVWLGVDVREGVLKSNNSATTYCSSVDQMRDIASLGELRGECKTPLR